MSLYHAHLCASENIKNEEKKVKGKSLLESLINDKEQKDIR